MAKLVEKAKKVVEEKVENIKKPEAWATDMELADVSSDAITYIAKVAVKNPYSCPIPICQISYSLKSKGRAIASGTIGDQGSLPSNDTTTLNVPLKVPHSVVVSLVTDIGEDWDIDYELDLGITIDLPVFGGFTVPIHTQGVIKLPTLSNLWNAEEYFHSEGETKFPSLSEIGKSNFPGNRQV